MIQAKTKHANGNGNRVVYGRKGSFSNFVIVNSCSYCCAASPTWVNMKNGKLLDYKYEGWSVARHRQSRMCLTAQHVSSYSTVVEFK
jgi:hypothetical protein